MSGIVWYDTGTCEGSTSWRRSGVSVQVLAIRFLGLRLNVSVERSRRSREARLVAVSSKEWMGAGQICGLPSTCWDRIVSLTIAQMALRRYL
jgi:hypothetical protein